ncbi:MAG: HAMP domain-containing protein [Rhodocyclales bacterium]|nr:HAMP domain-containing protein [Rhodocyclales bacterium]
MSILPAHRPSLHTRISLVLTALAATLLLALGGLWLHGVRGAVHEEVEAATRVSEQWLAALVREERGAPVTGAAVPSRATEAAQPSPGEARLIAHLRALGRIRANVLEVVAPSGERLYVSPPPTYKAGRAAPAWFAALAEPQFAPRRIDAGGLTLLLHPDASRAVLDAWDDLAAMAGWAAALLALLFVGVRRALARALRPLGQVVAALDRTARRGADFRFDARLPSGDAPELDRLARAFNGMADRLAQAVDENVRLEADREVARRLQAGLEDERRAIARELHDELAQGITAVRALAGAIAQRTGEQPALFSSAQSIVAVTGEMQDGVRAILQRLRPAAAADGLAAALQRHCAGWRTQQPQIELDLRCALGDAPLREANAQAVLRIVQEGLTNVVRHAGAQRVDIRLGLADGCLELVIADDGRGLAAPSQQRGCGLGLTGMAERVAALGGELNIGSRAGGGVCVVARLPEPSLSSGALAAHSASEDHP